MSDPVIVSAVEAETIDLCDDLPSVVVIADVDAEQASTAAAGLREKGLRTAVFVGGPDNQAAIDEFVRELFDPR